MRWSSSISIQGSDLYSVPVNHRNKLRHYQTALCKQTVSGSVLLIELFRQQICVEHQSVCVCFAVAPRFAIQVVGRLLKVEQGLQATTEPWSIWRLRQYCIVGTGFCKVCQCDACSTAQLDRGGSKAKRPGLNSGTPDATNDSKHCTASVMVWFRVR